MTPTPNLRGAPALTIWRPWTTLILRHSKTVENRPWHTNYRGWILIHAGTRFDDTALDHAAALDIDLSPQPAEHPMGIVGYTWLATICCVGRGAPGVCDCPPDWAVPGQCHWRLAGTTTIPNPVGCPGRQGLWYPDPATAYRVTRQLDGTP